MLILTYCLSLCKLIIYNIYKCEINLYRTKYKIKVITLFEVQCTLYVHICVSQFIYIKRGIYLLNCIFIMCYIAGLTNGNKCWWYDTNDSVLLPLASMKMTSPHWTLPSCPTMSQWSRCCWPMVQWRTQFVSLYWIHLSLYYSYFSCVLQILRTLIARFFLNRDPRRQGDYSVTAQDN